MHNTSSGLVAFLFPGQGSQSAGMGKELAEKHSVARQTFEEADDALGYKLSEVCFSGTEEQLRMTEIAQPAILTASVAAARVLRQSGVEPGFAAGHSLGEYSALVVAGALGFADAVATVRERGKYMQEAVPVGAGTMSAIIGMAPEKVTQVCADAAGGEVCEVANFNSPEQIVISGHTGAVERATALASERGAKKAKVLPVSAPFHSSLMKPAQDRLAERLRAVAFRSASLPVICNVDAAVLDGAERSREALIRQVTASVRWEQSVRLLIEKGAQTFIEVGPGKVLWGLMRQIDRSVNALYAGDPASVQKVVEHSSGVNA